MAGRDTPLVVGLDKAIRGLARGLAAAGAEVTILHETDVEADYRDPAGYRVISFANPGRKRPFGMAPSLRSYLASAGPDRLFVLNGIFNPSVSAVARVIAANGGSYVVAPHDPYNPAMFRKSFWLKHPYWYLCEAPMLRRAKAVQVLDRRHGDFLPAGVARRVIEVPNGVDAVPTPIPANDRLPREHASFISLGRLDVYNKGHDLLLRGFAHAFPAGDTTLVVQGPDQDGGRAQLDTLAARLGITDRVHFKPPDFEVPSTEIIGRHDAFCVASRYEGFCLAALEAMLAGRVVLITEIAGIAPHITAAGCGVVAKPTVAGIAKAFRELWEQRRDWPEMGRRGRDYAVKHLRWSQIGAKALTDYAALMRE